MTHYTMKKIRQFNGDYKFYSELRDRNLLKFADICRKRLPNITQEEIQKRFWANINKLAKSDDYGSELARGLLNHFIYHKQ